MTMMTSAEAAKRLRLLNERHQALVQRERKTSLFTVAIQENVEDVRPAYDFRETQDELNQLEAQVRVLKHAINRFNLTQKVPGFDMTIDQMLVYIPQLTAKKARLDQMRSRLPKERSATDRFSRSSNIIEYDYSNYDIRKAEEEYQRVADELARAQNALDKVNSTVAFAVE